MSGFRLVTIAMLYSTCFSQAAAVGFHLLGAEIDERLARRWRAARRFRSTARPMTGIMMLSSKLAAGGAGEGDGLVVADDAGADLHHAFAHDGIDLARHDRASPAGGRAA